MLIHFSTIESNQAEARFRVLDPLRMKIIPAAVLVLLMWSGCFHLSPEQKRAISAPPGVATEISMAAPSFYLRHNRWPKTKKDMLEGLRGMNQKPEFALDIKTLTVVEESEGSILYYCTFPDGGSTEIRVNLKIETEPNRAPETTIPTVTDRAPSSTLRASEDRVSP